MTGAKASAQDAAQPQNGESQELDPAKLQLALAEAQQLAATHKDSYLRAMAEMDNTRKRAQRDVENASRYGGRSLRRAAAGTSTASGCRQQ